MLENRTFTNDIAIDSIIIQVFYSQNTLTMSSFCASCETLTALATYSEKMQNRFLESQIYTFIQMLVVKFFQTKSLSYKEQYEMRMAAVNALRSLVIFNLSAKELFFNEEVQYLEALNFIMNIDFHKYQCDQFEEPLAANILFLASLVEYNPIKYDFMQGKRCDIRYLLNCDICSKNASIMEAIQELLIVLSGLESETEYLLDILSITGWCELCSRFPNVYSIQKNTIVFLQLNSCQIDKIEQSSILTTIADMLVKSTKLFDKSLVIKFEASVLIQILIKQYPEFVKICVHHDLDLFLFETINLDFNEDLVLVALQAFHVLIESNETRESIVTKAVNLCNLMLLECMIGVGSDLSNISIGILLAAVKQKNESLSSSLISHLLINGCRPNKYIINCCFEANNYSGAALLLRYYGIHESDRGHLINWSGLGIGHFNVSWILILSQELDVEIDRNMKWLSKRIKQESKNRMLLRKYYENYRMYETKLFRYPVTQTRSLEKKIGGYTYYTMYPDPIVSRMSYTDQNVDDYKSLINPKHGMANRNQRFSLQIIDKDLTAVQSKYTNNDVKSVEFEINERISKPKTERLTYKIIPGELNEFLMGFRCGTDYSYHPLDPRGLLKEGPKSSRESKIPTSLFNIVESDLNAHVKILTNKNWINVLPGLSSDRSSFSEINSETKDDVNQISHLDLSNNKLSDLKEFREISKDPKLILMYKNVTTLKLEKNSIKSIGGKTFQVMETLQHLNLSDNNLTDFPWSVFKYCPLNHLNVSKNKIKRFCVSVDDGDYLKSRGKVKFLTQLFLSDNNFSEFDINSLAIFPNLQTLDMNSIAINISKNDILSLPNLRKINMKYNTLTSINENFLKLSRNIIHINFSENLLKPIENTFEINLSLFDNLVSVDLSHNDLACGKPFFIPRCILKIPKLQNLDMSYNNILEFPPCAMWTSTDLTDLNFSHNKIQNFDLLNAKTSFQHLQILDLSYNLLKRIPPDIGHLYKLTLLNISHNPNLKSLPDEIGLLKDKNLNSLIREGLTLNYPKYFDSSTHVRDILKYYYNRLKRSVEYNGLKLMVLGYGGRGKTSLLNSLQGNRRPKHQVSTTIGIDVSNWKIQNRQMDKVSEYKFTCWDMAGQEDFFCTHECFLSQRALYLLVFDLTKEIEEVRILKPWLSNLRSQAPHAPIIMVGTHLDELRENVRNSHCLFMKNSITKLCLTPGFPKTISDIVFVDSRSPNETITNLKMRILNVLNSHRVHTEIMTMEKQPSSYIKLEEIFQETLKTLSPNYPILTEKEIKNLVLKHKLDLDGDELKQAIQFLHNCGILVHFNDTLMRLNDLYFLKPQWLCSMMARIITLKYLNPFIHNGIMKLSDFLQLFRSTLDSRLPNNVTIETHSLQCLKILEKFDVVFKSSSDEIIIPSKLPSHRPNHEIMDRTVSKITRIFEFTFLPSGFWPRLITRISVLARSFDELFKVTKRHLVLWKTGVIISFEDSIYLVLEEKQQLDQNTEIIEISVTKSELGIKILVKIVDCIEVLIDEWYPGLVDTDHFGNRIMISYALCPDCNSRIDLIDIVQQSMESDQISCKQCTEIEGRVKQLPIRIIAPDIVLGDLPDDLIINPDFLKVDRCQENLIGSGGNGLVYKGTYMGEDCAVKYINSFEHSSEPPSYRLLRQEIDVLRKSQHSSLIKFLGADRERIVMEFAPLRDLKHILSNYILPRRLLQRIAYQIISGIEYLHLNMILYRDVKMQNILVFSIELSAHINVKLSDYGISRPVAPFGFVNPQGTPGYQAPEVITKAASYELPADIFSFGILLYNIATRGHHPSDAKTHWRAGKQTELISVYRCENWPRMQDCINKCTKLVPEDRPDASTLVKFISCPSFIAIKNVWHLTKKTRIECMITKLSDTRKVEVFLANGNQFQQEVRWLDVTTGQSKGKPFFANSKPNRILSMLLVNDMLFLGSQDGELSVYNHSENELKRTSVCFEDSILCMVLINLEDNSQVIMLGLANGMVRYKVEFTTIADLTCSDFNKIYLADSPVTNLYFSKNQIFATCGSGIYKLIFPEEDDLCKMVKILELEISNQKKWIKCFCPIIENINNVLVTTFYFTIRNESLIYNHDDQGNQLKPAIDCRKLIKDRMSFTDSDYSARIMCLTIWSGDRYIAAGTGTGHLIVIDQKIEYIVILNLFRNPITCMQHTRVSNGNAKFDKDNYKSITATSLSILENFVNHEDPIKVHNQNSGLIIVGNGYKSIEEEDFDGAALVQLSDDLSNISRQLDKHISLRNIFV